MSFLSIFACVIKELLTKSDMATDDIDVDMEGQRQYNRPDEDWYFPPLGRAGNLVMDLTGRGRGLRPSPVVGRAHDFPQNLGGKRSEISIPASPQICCSSLGRAGAIAQLWEWAEIERVRTRTYYQPPEPPYTFPRCLYLKVISPAPRYKQLTESPLTTPQVSHHSPTNLSLMTLLHLTHYWA